MPNIESVTRPLHLKTLEFITKELSDEVAQAHQKVLSFDSFSPADIRKTVAVPRVRIRPGGEEVIVYYITLGGVSENFPDYIGNLKEPPSESFVLQIDKFELAMLLMVLKNHEPLRSLRDYFADRSDYWLQKYQGPSLRISFLREIETIRGEKKIEFYEEAVRMEELIALTDFIHQYCLVVPPLNSYPNERFEFEGKKSWFDLHDGKSIGDKQNILSTVRELS